MPATLESNGRKTESDLCSLLDSYSSDKNSAHSYGPFYEQLLSLQRNAVTSVLEIGIYHGASLRAWRDYFPNARVSGIDINPDTMLLGEDRIETFLGRQDDPADFAAVIARGPFDLIIDDGSHEINDQLASWMSLRDFLKADGVYVVEDIYSENGRECFTGLGFDVIDLRVMKDRNDDVLAIWKPQFRARMNAA